MPHAMRVPCQRCGATLGESKRGDLTVTGGRVTLVTSGPDKIVCDGCGALRLWQPHTSNLEARASA